MFDLFSEILQTLRHNKLRTALTGLSVAWGIFMLIVLLGMGNGVTNSFKEEALAPGSQKIQVWGGRTSKPYHGYREGRFIQLKNADIDRLEKENSGFIEEVGTEIYGNQVNITAGTRSVKASYTGVFPSQIRNANNIDSIHGRAFSDKDMRQHAKVIVLPRATADELFPSDGLQAIGKHINVGGLAFLVCGVYDSRWGRTIYIPYTTAQMLTGNEDNPGSLQVMVKNLTTIEEGDQAEADIKQTLSAAHEFDPDDTSAVWVWNQFTGGLKGLQAMSILNISIWVLGLLTLLSGVVGISNIMFVSVKERTHEIGIRRAIGAKPRSILTQVMAESIAITTLFGYIGIVLGTAVTQVLDTVFRDVGFIKNPTINLSLAFEVTVVLIIAGALAGLFPALKSLKVKPVEALRDE